MIVILVLLRNQRVLGLLGVGIVLTVGYLLLTFAETPTSVQSGLTPSVSLRSIDALRGTSNSDIKLLFSKVGNTQLVGVGVSARSGEYVAPTTKLTLENLEGVVTIESEPVEYSKLSADGTKVIYITNDKRTYLYDIATKSKQLITSSAAF